MAAAATAIALLSSAAWGAGAPAGPAPLDPAVEEVVRDLPFTLAPSSGDRGPAGCTASNATAPLAPRRPVPHTARVQHPRRTRDAAQSSRHERLAVASGGGRLPGRYPARSEPDLRDDSGLYRQAREPLRSLDGGMRASRQTAHGPALDVEGRSGFSERDLGAPANAGEGQEACGASLPPLGTPRCWPAVGPPGGWRGCRCR